MTADPNSIDLPALLEARLQRAEPDLLRSMLSMFVQALMSAEADAVCGADYGSRSPERVNRRNGYRVREWDTGAGTVELAIPKLREGSYPGTGCWSGASGRSGRSPQWWPPAICLGVSTRRMEKLVEQLGVTRLSKSQVSVMARSRAGEAGCLTPSREFESRIPRQSGYLVPLGHAGLGRRAERSPLIPLPGCFN